MDLLVLIVVIRIKQLLAISYHPCSIACAATYILTNQKLFDMTYPTDFLLLRFANSANTREFRRVIGTGVGAYGYVRCNTHILTHTHHTYQDSVRTQTNTQPHTPTSPRPHAHTHTHYRSKSSLAREEAMDNHTPTYSNTHANF